MVNLIKQDLKEGDNKACVPEDSEVSKPEQLDAFIEQACTKVLDDQQNAFDLAGGTLDTINKCTKKEFFCGVCCQFQFGSDKLVKRNNCEFSCTTKIGKFLPKKTEYMAELTQVVQKDAYNEISKKVESE